VFVFFAQDATPIQPIEGAFNFPALPLDDKFAMSRRAFHDINDDAKPSLRKLDKPAFVALIH